MTSHSSFLPEATLYKKQKMLWLLLALSALSFFVTLGLPYQGEEAVYTITSLEMWYYNEWFAPLAYGNDYGRPPLFNWAIIPLAILLGWKKVLVASRVVTMLSTFGSTCLLLILTQRLFRNKTLSLFTGCIFLSGDLLFRRGWLAYADPIFSFFVFLAIVSLWLCLESKHKVWLLLAILGLIASYLAKALTGYVFYAGALLVLLFRHPNRSVLWTPFSIILHSFALLFILLWDYLFSNSSHSAVMMGDIVTKFNVENIFAYLVKFTLFPLDTFYRFLPCSALLLYFWLKDCFTKKSLLPLFEPNANKTLLIWIILINYVPYWIAPFTRIRYLLPLYPFISLLIAYGLYELGKKDQTRMNTTLLALWLCVVLKYIWVGVGMSYFEEHYKRDYETTAEDILKQVENFPLYTTDMTALGLSVAAHLDVLRLPQAPLKSSVSENAFVLTNTPDSPNTQIVKIYSFDKDSIYLLCSGSACP